MSGGVVAIPAVSFSFETEVERGLNEFVGRDFLARPLRALFPRPLQTIFLLMRQCAAVLTRTYKPMIKLQLR